MRVAMAMLVLGLLTACAAQPSASERAFLSASEPRSALVRQDVQSMLSGIQHARDKDERVARYGR